MTPTFLAKKGADMQFKAVIKDAKLTSRGVNIHLVGGDDLSTDELRAYLDEMVMVNVEIVQPVQAAGGWEIDGELAE